jgi:hypothetical protein
MSARPKRSAWGFEVVADGHWVDRAACRTDPELWFRTDDMALALHICRSHCDVAAECVDYTARLVDDGHTPTDCVQAGVRWRSKGNKGQRGDGPLTSCQTQSSHDCPRCLRSDAGHKPAEIDGHDHAEASSLEPVVVT